jgi:predicted metal-dependent peptidase
MNNVYEEIAKFSKQLMLKEPFYGLVLISLNKELDKNIQTACVTPDKINTKLKVNPEFWSTLDDKTKLGVLKHELLHICFFHLTNWDRFDNKKVYNMAADLEINQYINSDMKGEAWDGLEIDSPTFAPLNLEPKKGTSYYYGKLMQDIQDNPDGDISKMAGGDEKGKGDGFVCDLDGVEGLSEAEKKLIAKQIDHQLKDVTDTLEKKSSGRGLVPGEMKDYIDSLFEIVEPVIDWKSYLRRFNSMSTMVYTKKTRRKPNRRFGTGPALKIKQKKRTLVAIDTSGSVSNDDLLEFFNEIYHIYKSGTYVDIIECDAKVRRVYEYKGEREEIEVQGRGGTDFEPVMVYLSENRDKYANLIYLTDGECVAPQTQPKKPMLWVHSSGHNINDTLPGAKVKIVR